MSILTKIFGGGAKEIIDAAGGVIDGLSTSSEEKSVAKANLSEIVTSKLTELAGYQRDVLVQEMKGNWLQRSWRPIIMLTFGAICVIAVFHDVKLNNVPDEFWGLLKIGIGGYVAGRSLEKITGNVTKNIDMPFLKKKDRKERS